MTLPTPPTSFFDELLRLPTQAVFLACQRRLEALRPGSTVLHTRNDLFDLVRFLHDGEATSVVQNEPGELREYWTDDGNQKLTISLVHRWDTVSWKGETLEVVHVTLREDSCTDTGMFVIAPHAELARRFLLAVFQWCSTVRGEVLVFDEGRFRTSEALHASIRAASLDDLVLPQPVLDAVRSDVRRFVNAKPLYASFRVPWKRGVLLIGPPGNGKTHTVRAMVKESGWPCLYVKSFQARHGEEQGIGQVFARARKAAPCVVVLEDLDCLINENNRSTLLNELDGFAQNDGLLIIATTNHPEKLDRSLLDRPSRFDRKFHFGLPAAEERRRYLQRWQADVSPALRINPATLEVLVEGTHGFTFAYLKELTLAAMLAFMESPLDGAMDEVAAEVLSGLKGEMSSARKLLPPVAGDERRISLS